MNANVNPGVDVLADMRALAAAAEAQKTTTTATTDDDRLLQDRERIAARGQVYKVRLANVLKGKWVLQHKGALKAAKTHGPMITVGERPAFRGHVYRVTEAKGPGGRFVFRYVGRVRPTPAPAAGQTPAGEVAA